MDNTPAEFRVPMKISATFCVSYGVIACLMHCLTLFLILRRSPFHSIAHGRLLMTYQSIMFVQDVFFCWLFIPYAPPPFIVVYCQGLLCQDAVFGFQKLAGLWFIFACSELVTLLVCLAHKHQVLMRPNHPLHVGPCMRALICFIAYGAVIAIGILNMVSEIPIDEQLVILESHPNLKWITSSGLSWVAFSQERLKPVQVAAATFLLSFFAIFSALVVMIARALSGQGYSEQTRRIQRRATNILILQLASMIFLIIFPSFLNTIVVATGGKSLPQWTGSILSQLVTYMFPLHTMANTVIFIVLHPRYVQELKQIFLCVVRHKSSVNPESISARKGSTAL